MRLREQEGRRPLGRPKCDHVGNEGAVRKSYLSTLPEAVTTAGQWIRLQEIAAKLAVSASAVAAPASRPGRLLAQHHDEPSRDSALQATGLRHRLAAARSVVAQALFSLQGRDSSRRHTLRPAKLTQSNGGATPSEPAETACAPDVPVETRRSRPVRAGRALRAVPVDW